MDLAEIHIHSFKFIRPLHLIVYTNGLFHVASFSFSRFVMQNVTLVFITQFKMLPKSYIKNQFKGF